MNPAPLALAALLGLAACVPIPIIPHRLQFRDDPPQTMTLPANPSRTDFLLALGEPDGAGPQESWLAWTGAGAPGGLGYILMTPTPGAGAVFEQVRYRRRLVRFDPSGRMTENSYAERICTDATTGGAVPTLIDQPCVGWNWVSGQEP